MILLDITNPDIAFDGWAIALIVFFLSCLGFGSYRIIKKGVVKQKQSAGSGAKQEQEVGKETAKDKKRINQTQKGGNNSEQSQKA